MAPSDSADDIEAARLLLRRLIRAQGLTLQEIDAKLQYARGYLSRIVNGETRLTYQHILDILRAIDVPPSLYFTTLHPPAPRPSAEQPLLQELRAVLDRLLPSLPPPANPPEPLPTISDDDLQARIDAAVRAVRRRHLSEGA
jgi:transcriptional regulator with XRE-family HTH domain